VIEPKPYIELDDFPNLTPFTAAAIRAYMHRGELVEGTHYFRAPGRGKRRPGRPIFKWAAIVEWIESRRPECVSPGEQITDIVPLRRRA
jgi:hypothetical protein